MKLAKSNLKAKGILPLVLHTKAKKPPLLVLMKDPTTRRLERLLYKIHQIFGPILVTVPGRVQGTRYKIVRDTAIFQCKV